MRNFVVPAALVVVVITAVAIELRQIHSEDRAEWRARAPEVVAITHDDILAMSYPGEFYEFLQDMEQARRFGDRVTSQRAKELWRFALAVRTIHVFRNYPELHRHEVGSTIWLLRWEGFTLEELGTTEAELRALTRKPFPQGGLFPRSNNGGAPAPHTPPHPCGVFRLW